jgi:hypothetical protein
MKYVLSICVFFIVGCASTGVVKVGEDTFMIGKKDGTPGLGVSLSNKAEVYKEANDFCQRDNLEFQVIRELVTPARPAQLGSTEIQFKCVKKGSGTLPLQREADRVIEIRNR